MISIVNYGLGNVLAFYNIYKRLDIPVRLVSKNDEIKNSKKLILPGVGAFDWAIERLNKSGLREQIDEMVLDKKIPVLGVCVGMQIMADRSEEGKMQGLGWIPGFVKRFNINDLKQKHPLPHMGWNQVYTNKKNLLFNFNSNPEFYFLHSYYFDLKNNDHCLGKTNYGIKFASVINFGNIFGVQFHPEKSHNWGISLLKNFSKL